MTAAGLKEEGNAKFKAGDFAAAVDAYTQSLELDPKQHLCYSNRSAAYLKMGGNAEKALADANQCVELAPAFAKGYSRQAAALQDLKRWEDALAALERGLTATSDDALKATVKEVKNRQFLHLIQGCWNGRVTPDLGDYEQEMEFMADGTVRVEVLGRCIVGRFSVDANEDPRHLNIQVPMADAPVGVPQPPPVPYIAKVDEKGLHLCCPYMKMERPTSFEGSGYCLMQKGSLHKDVDKNIAKLSKDEQLLMCAKELCSILPKQKIQEVKEGEPEEASRDKLMAQVKFESSMYALSQKFGEEITKQVLTAATKGEDVSKALNSSEELKTLRAKLKVCGLMDDVQEAEAQAQAVTKSSSSGQGSRQNVDSQIHSQPTSSAAPEPPVLKPDGSEPGKVSAESGRWGTIGVLALGVAAAATVLVLWRRQRSTR